MDVLRRLVRLSIVGKQPSGPMVFENRETDVPLAKLVASKKSPILELARRERIIRITPLPVEKRL
jgi:hypothetical protein